MYKECIHAKIAFYSKCICIDTFYIIITVKLFLSQNFTYFVMLPYSYRDTILIT